MFSKSLSKMTVMTVLGLGAFSPMVLANDGIAHLGGSYAGAGNGHTFVGGGTGQYYIMSGSPYGTQQYTPNPTYYTKLSCPLHHQCDYCGDPACSGNHGLWTVPAVRWTLDPNYYTVAPDYGWSPPGKWAIHRDAPVYQKYVPDQWYGTGRTPQRGAPAYPVVAQPTDTTQLGYYYQTVPQWQPNPGMLPPPPNPRTWHRREYEVGPDGTSTRWVPLVNAWVPIQQLPQAAPTPAKPDPQPMPVPVEPQKAAPPPPEAAVQTEIQPETIQRTGFFQRLMKRN